MVSRSSKQPIAGAAVVVSIWRDGERHEQHGKTDAQGSCKFDLPQGVAAVSTFSAKDGFVPIADSWPQGELSQVLPATWLRELEPGFPIGGFVRDEKGRPVAGAEVEVALDRRKTMAPDVDLPQGSNGSIYAPFPSITVKTDESGRWRCSALPADAEQTTRLWFYVSHPDHVSDSRGYSRRLSLKTARAMTEAFVVRSGVQVAGQAHDAHGKAVPGATVVLAYSGHTGDFLRTKTDQAGRFVFAHADDKPSLGRTCLSVEAVGFSPAWKMLVPGGADSRPRLRARSRAAFQRSGGRFAGHAGRRRPRRAAMGTMSLLRLESDDRQRGPIPLAERTDDRGNRVPSREVRVLDRNRALPMRRREPSRSQSTRRSGFEGL